jgi:DNA polymerase I-like protein with 3'-5' exonuclease and polymerase domains
MTVQLPPIALDFETFYTKEYSLTKMTPVHYVLDPKFEVIGFAYAEDGKAAHWFSGTFAETKAALESLQLDKRLVICHNAMFDGSILEWQFGIRPLKYFCTMMGSRPFITPFTGAMSLAKGAEYLELPSKGDEVAKVIDKRRLDFSAPELRRYGEYCVNDVNICMAMFHFIMARLPEDEADLIDLTIRKFTRGKLQLDRDKLQQAQEDIADAEAKALLVLAALGVKREQITSNPQLAMLLKSYGVEPPSKASPADPTRQTFAFAKKDPEFLALKNHPDSRVQQIVEARLLLKSSIERTRVQQFLELERIHDRLPVPLLYYGAHTGRFSGMMGINLQNLPRGSALRKSVVAPPGYKIISADLSAIEARITAVLAGQWDLVDRFRHGADVYSEFATELYGYPVSSDPSTFTERFVGKMCILGLGFGMGPPKFNLTMASLGIPMDEDESIRIVGVYRKKFRFIPQLWRSMDACVSKMIELQNGLAWYGFPDKDTLLTFKQKQVILPNGMPIFYPLLSRDPQNRCVYQVKETPSKVYWKPLWGGSLTENVVQAMARIILSRAELRLAKAGLESALQVHDELVYVVPEAAAPRVVDVVRRVLTDPVPWMPRLPLACTIGVGNSYGETK